MNQAAPIQHAKQTQYGIFSFLGSLVQSVFWACVIAFAINIFVWCHDGYGTVCTKLEREYHAQVNAVAIRSHTLAVVLSLFASHVTIIKNQTQNHVNALLNQHKQVQALLTNEFVKRATSHIKSDVARFWQVLIGTLNLTFLKFLSIGISVLVFAVAGLIGAMDGLLVRYVRTAEAGRESTFLFHRVAGVMLKAPIKITMLYLAFPFFINPEIVVLFISFLFFVFTRLYTANLKKFM